MKYFLIICLIIMGVEGFVIYEYDQVFQSKQNKFTELNKQFDFLKKQNQDCEKQIMILSKKQLNPKFVDWAYKNSSKISYNQCKDIVEFIFSNVRFPIFTLALIQRESSINPLAVSSGNARGLGQIIWSIWKKDLQENNLAHEQRDLFDWKTNLMCVDYIIKKMHNQHNGDWDKVLRHYVGADNKKYISDIYRNIGELTLLDETYPVSSTNVQI